MQKAYKVCKMAKTVKGIVQVYHIKEFYALEGQKWRIFNRLIKPRPGHGPTAQAAAEQDSSFEAKVIYKYICLESLSRDRWLFFKMS